MSSERNWKKSWICLSVFLFGLFICLCFQNDSLAEETYSNFLEITGCYSGFIYRDEMLFGNQYELSTDLAKASAVLSRGAYSSETPQMLQAMGYNTESFNYDGDESLGDDLVAYTIGYRDIPGSNKRIICVVVRGTQGLVEWISNFDLGISGKHNGFQNAADDVEQTLTGFLTGGKEIILWFTGHSRGAAVANILAARYNTLGYKVFGYTFACPAVSILVSESGNIWNFNNDRDLVTKVPPGYQRNGHDYSIYWPSTLTQEYEEKIDNLFEISSDLTDPLHLFRIGCIGYILSGSTDVSISDLLQLYGDIPELDGVKDLSNVFSLTAFESNINARHVQYSEDLQYFMEIRALIENMSDDDFELYISEHSDINERIFSIINKQADKKADILLAVNHLGELIEDIAESESELELVFTLAKEAKFIADAVKDAHDSFKYMNHINKLFFGYQGEAFSTSTIITMPANITTVGARCFIGSLALDYVSMPKVVYIGSEAFRECSALSSVNMNSIKCIGNNAFRNCEGLAELTLPDGLERIGDWALFDCSGLTALTVPDSVQTLGTGCLPRDLISLTIPFLGSCRQANGTIDAVFYHVFGCLAGIGDFSEYDIPKLYAEDGFSYYIYPSQLENLTITDTEIIPDYAFEMSGYQDFSDYSTIVHLTMPEGITSIGKYAFCDYKTLSGEWVIPENITEIKDHTFYGCSGITGMTLPDGLTRICQYAFTNCSGLTELALPDGLEEIEGCALYGCSGLTALTVPDSVQRLGNGSLPRDLYSLTIPFVGSCREANGTNDAVFYYVFGEHDGGWSFDDVDYFSKYYRSDKISYYYFPNHLKNLTITDTEIIPDYAFETSVHQNYNDYTTIVHLTMPDSITSIGEYAFCNCRTLSGKWVIPEGITEIKDHTFYGCSGITGMTLPDSLKKIGQYAFSNCSGLTELDLPDGLETIEKCGLYGCSGLTALTVPDSVQTLGNGSLPRDLTSLTIPFVGSCREANENYDAVFYYVFGEIDWFWSFDDVGFPKKYNHSNISYYIYPYQLEDLTITDTEIIPDYAFETSLYQDCSDCMTIVNLTLPDSITSIGEYAFYNCKTLSGEWVIPEGITEVKDHTFYGCSGITGMTLPGGLKKIGQYAFCNCSGLTELDLPDGLEEIEAYGLYGCSRLTTLTVPDSVQTLGNGSLPRDLTSLTIPFVGYCRGANGNHSAVFYYVFGEINEASDISFPKYYDYKNTAYYIYPYQLKDLTITDTTIIPDYAFETSLYQDCSDCMTIVHLTLPDSVTSIGKYAFYNCKTLSNEWVIPEGVTEIKDHTFYGCSGITRMALPGSLKIIGQYAFCNCSGLTELDLPDGLEEIEAYGLYGCSGLTALTVPNSVQILGNGSLPRDLTSLTIPFVGYCRGANGNHSAVFYYVFGEINEASDISFPKYYDYKNTAYYIYPYQLKDLTITDTTIIPDYAFETSLYQDCSDCMTIVHLTLPNSVSSIGKYAFYNCKTLTGEWTIPIGVTEIKDYTFYGCSGMTGMTLPSYLEKIGFYALEGCSGLTYIVYPGTLDGWAHVVVEPGNNPITELGITCTIQYIEPDFVLPSYLHVIEEEAFSGIAAVSVLLPDTVSSIGSYAFSDCPNLKQIIIPSSVTEIDDDAFAGITGLVIYGENSSVAETFAKQHYFVFCIFSSIPNTAN